MTKENKIQKLVDGRKEYLQKNNGLVCIIDERIEIWADEYQFVLKKNEQTKGYFGSIEMVLDELLSMKQKELMIANKRKDLLSAKQAIEESRVWMEEIINPLFDYKTNK